MKKLLCTIFALFLCTYSGHAQADTVWGSTDADGQTTEMRIAVDISAVGIPSFFSLVPSVSGGIFFNSSGNFLNDTGFTYDDVANTLSVLGNIEAANYCDESGANCRDPVNILENIVEDLTPQLGANLDTNTFTFSNLAADTQVYYNSAGIMNGDAGLVFADVANDLKVTGDMWATDYCDESGANCFDPVNINFGTDQQVLFSDSGVMAGDAGILYNSSSNTLTMTGPVIDTADMPSARTADHTFALSDLGAYIRYDSTGSLSATVPPNSSVAFPIGQMLFGQIFDGTNTLTLVEGSGVIIESSDSLVYTSAGFALIKTATDVWTAFGGD